MPDNTTITIILPVYNPPSNWEQLVAERYAVFSKLYMSVQLVIVNDGSTNHFFEAGKKELTKSIPNLRLIENKINSGKGHALRCGVSNSHSDLYLLTDIDLPYTPESMQAVITTLTAGADIAIGVRDNDYYKNVSGFRAALSKALRFFIRHFLKIPFDDTQCGLKGFNENGKGVFLKTRINRYLFDLEFIMLAVRNKLIQLKSTPVYLRPGIHLSKMPVKILLQESVNFIKLLFRK